MLKAINKVVNNLLNCRKERSYVIKEMDGMYYLCKVLNKYYSKDEAIENMSMVLTDEVSELNILSKKVE